MRKIILKILFFLILLKIPACLFAQNTDSLEYVARFDKNKNNRIDAYIELAYAYYGQKDPLKVKSIVNEGLKLSEKLKSNENSAFLLYYLSLSVMDDNDFSGAINFFGQAEEYIADKEKNKIFLSEILKFKALCHYYLGNYQEAIKINLNALNIYKEENTYFQGEINQNLGLIYSQIDLKDKALVYHKAALKVYKNINAIEEMASIYQNIGVIYSSQKEYEQSYEYYKRSLDIYKELKNTEGIANAQINIAVLFIRLQDYNQALQFLNNADNYFARTNNYRGLIHVYNNFGKIYFHLNNRQKALSYYIKCFNISVNKNYTELLTDTYLNLSELYKSSGNFKKALEFNEAYIHIKDSIFGIEKYEAISEIENKHAQIKRSEEIDKISKEQKLKSTQVKRQRVIIILLISVVLIISGLVFFLILYSRQKNIINNQLKNEIQDRILAEKNLEVLTKNLESIIKERTEELTVVNKKLVHDITEQKQLKTHLETAKRKAEQADMLKTIFLSNMSHEIRTPMNGIIGFAQLLKQKELEYEKHNEYIDVIINNSTNLIQLIEDIVDISKIESGNFQPNPSVFNLDEVLFQCIVEFNEKKYQVNKEHIKLIYLNHENEDSIPIESDRFRVKQVMSHLLNNALKFTDNGNIKFGYKLNQNEVIISVSDTGIGIHKEKHKLIFNLFRQADEGSTRKYGGTGLGLYLSQSIISNLGGELNLESIPGKGSTFYFSLPLNWKQKKEFLQPVKKWNNVKALIIDDQEVNYIFINEIIKETNAQTIWARNGREALGNLNQTPDIDLIIIDLHTPGMDSFKTVRRIREIKPHIPIIAQTSFALDMSEKKCNEYGCNSFITKPVNVNKLLQTMEKNLETTLVSKKN